MSRLEHATEITNLAADLGLAGAANPVEAILRHCRRRIDAWVAEARRLADRVIAIVQLVEPVRQQSQGPKVEELYE